VSELLSVRCRGVDIRDGAAVETAGGTMTSTPLALVDVETGDGVTGRAYARAYTPLALRALVELVRALGAVVAGGPASPVVVHERLRRELALVGRQGLAGMALSAIDMALWDADARRGGMSLAALLGGAPGPVPADAALRTMAPDRAARDAATAVERGFRAVKVKVGGGSAADDVARLAAVRDAVGPAVAVLVDFNQSLTRAQAPERLRALEPYAPEWVEEPLDAHDDAGHAALGEAGAVPIAIGENWWGVDGMRRSLEAGACDHAVLDVGRIGGVTGWLRAAELARTAAVSVSSHAFPEFSAQLLRVTPTARWLEYLDHAAPILTEPVAVRDGAVVAGGGPGAGLTWREEAVERWRVC
jgi:mandelate racemase